MIPPEINDVHIHQAADRIDREGVPPTRLSKYYEVVINGKTYPPKYVVSIAASFATGQEYPWEKFNAVERKFAVLKRGTKKATWNDSHH